MKAIIEFDLDTPADGRRHLLAVQATELALVIYDIDQHLRDRIKYGDCPEPAVEILEKTRERLRELLMEYNISNNLIFE